MSENKNGRLIVIDAIDGAGKSTAIKGMHDFLETQGIAPAFDMVAFQQEHHRLPEITELEGAKLLLAAEPTQSWIGAGLRNELIAKHPDRSYSALSATHAFALDREILYKRVIMPFLSTEPGRVVIQDRGLISTLAYQPLQDPELNIEEMLELPGNQTELSRAPDVLLLLTLDVAIAQERLADRTEKRDESVFENEDFQSALTKRYLREDVRRPFIEHGTKIVEIDASQTPEMTVDQIIEQIKPLL